MITISNLRMEETESWTKLVCDFGWDADIPNPFHTDNLWIAVKSENVDFLSSKVYDPFVLVPYYAAMQYGQDLKICGKVSKKLYRNLVNYAQRILLDFSDELSPVSFTVDGFDVPEKKGNLIGAGISCGVDSLSTIYNRYVRETDPDWRINALFCFNYGTCGDYEDARTRRLFEERLEQNRRAAEDLGLPVFEVDSNLHSITHRISGQKVGFFAQYSCVLFLQSAVSRYYIASGLSYGEIAECQRSTHNFDMDEYCGSYMVPLIQTESVELVYEGAQYKRSEKTALISDWDIAQKHLNVCVSWKRTAENCSCCPKCFRTLIDLEALGKLDAFSGVFDLSIYKKTRFRNLCVARSRYWKDPFSKDNIDFAREHGVWVPPGFLAYVSGALYRCARAVRKRISRGVGRY